MPHNNKPPKKESALTEQQLKRNEELSAEIKELPKKNHAACEGLIRELHKKISTIEKTNFKEDLLSDLKKVSFFGLSEELRALVEKHGLSLEALDLVLEYLTTKEELARHLFTSTKNTAKSDGLDAVKRRLGPKLEVLGGLSAKGIDVTKDNWVQKLVEKAPSLQSLSRLSVRELEELCTGASHGEMEDVNRLVKIAESYTRKIAAVQDEKLAGENNKSKKSIDEEKLEKAKALLNEAKKIAKQQSDEASKAVDEKMAEITKILELPPDWNKHDIGVKPEELFEDLDGIITQLNQQIEVDEAYKSDLEVVRKASGGRALCGIYHSVHVEPKTAEVPIIVMPDELILSSPNNSQQVRYIKFSKSRAAAKYVQTVKSLSTSIGLSVGGFYNLFVGEISGSYASRDDEEETTTRKEQTSNASVVQYIWIATKTFKIEQEQMKLTASARKMARNVKDPMMARCFMERYGSHFPAGLHTLGGVLFRIVDAESRSTKETSVLTEKAVQQLQSQISVGFLGGLFGIGASITAKHTSSSGKTTAQEAEIDDTSYTFSSQAMGPATTNPAAFNQLLANNSTWALIDRGSQLAYIPIWELIRDLGSDFHAAAQILEDTWRRNEEKNKLGNLRIGYQIIEIIRNDLNGLRDKYIQEEPDEKAYGHVPNNGAQLAFDFSTINLTRAGAYRKAVEIIMVDPRYRICVIDLCAGGLYTIRCWQAIEDHQMTFSSMDGEHVLFYSEILFKWKDKIPEIE